MRRLISLLILGVLGCATATAQNFNLFAAASLKESATEISKAFQKKYPNCTFSINFGGSQQLVAQIQHGAPCDVLMSAGMDALKALTFDKASLRIFATNKLTLVVPGGSRKVRSLHDLGSKVRLILADTHVPVGNYGHKVLQKAGARYGQAWLNGVSGNVISREQDVRAVLAKVALGEADAGIVYVTDVPAAKGKVNAIDIPDDLNVVADYPVVRFAGSSNADVARDFVRFLFERDAQKILVNHGFGSSIIPGAPIQVRLAGKLTVLDAKKISKLPLRSFSASEHGVKKNFKGYDLRPMIEAAHLGGGRATIVMSAGDGYTQSVPLDGAMKDGIYLVETAHDNYQVILPGQIPRYWVHWVREISIR